MVGKVGRDGFGDETLKNFENNQVGIKYLFTTDKSPSGVAPITVDSKVFLFL